MTSNITKTSLSDYDSPHGRQPVFPTMTQAIIRAAVHEASSYETVLENENVTQIPDILLHFWVFLFA